MTHIEFGLLALIATAQAALCADFAKDVQPIFETSCYACHGSKLQMGGLRLDEKKAALAGGKSGAVVEPGKSAESTLYKRIAGLDEKPRMPMGGKPLEPAQLTLIKNWIDSGASWPDTASASTKKHWAFVPP